MLVNDCVQGTEEWLQARLAIPTASCFDKIVTASGGKSAQANAYMGKLLAEYISGEIEECYVSPDMERGTKMEPLARLYYSVVTGNDVEEVGLVYKDKKKNISCSPDGLTKKRGLEIKCPKLGNHIGYVLDGQLPSKYKAQVQGSMWVTGLKQWDFVSYHPDFEQLIITVDRDDVFIAKLEKEVKAFSKQLEELKKQCADRKMEISA